MTFTGILISILMASLVAGVGSVWLADGLMRLSFPGGPARAPEPLRSQHLLSLAAGALLATSFMHLLPEAFEGQAGDKALFSTLLVSLVFFFLLDKAELWHHGHKHHCIHERGPQHDPVHDDAHAQDRNPLRLGAWTVITGDSVHCLGDGILIASAFVADFRLGLAAALAVFAHEVPHHLGDLTVLRLSSDHRGAALIKLSLAGAVTTLGGLAGWWLVDRLQEFLPFFLVIASSSFIYVALADLVPQLQERLSTRETAAQIASLLAGIALVAFVSRLH
jgi:zinc and cadmium transporter